MTSTRNEPELSPEAATPQPLSQAERKQRMRRRLERLIGIAATEGNALLPLRNGDEIFAAMLQSIRSAEHTVDMMTFVYWRGDIARQFAEALADRARNGVRVRLLLDGFGSRLIEQDLLDLMDRAGAEVAWFRKPLYLSPLKQNHRCHRKVLVVDESVAYTGGVGIAEEWCGNARNENEWRDTHVQVRGRRSASARAPAARRPAPWAGSSASPSTPVPAPWAAAARPGAGPAAACLSDRSSDHSSDHSEAGPAGLSPRRVGAEDGGAERESEDVG